MRATKIRKLIQYELDFNKTEIYFKEYLIQKHYLFDALRSNTSFRKGNFYTLLTEDADLAKLHEFEIGHILPPNPIEDVYISSLGRTFKGEPVNSIDHEFVYFIYEIIKNKHISLLAEDFVASPTDPHIDLYYKIGLHLGEEVFYLITPENLTKTLIKKLFKTCGSWFFIAALFDMNNLDFKNKEIKESDFLKICSNTSMIIISAYDGEGYLIWEKIQ